jgi:hypothetical protein
LKVQLSRAILQVGKQVFIERDERTDGGQFHRIAFLRRPRSSVRKSITPISGTFCYYISGRSTLSGSCRCCPVGPRRVRIWLKCSTIYKIGNRWTDEADFRLGERQSS